MSITKTKSDLHQNKKQLNNKIEINFTPKAKVAFQPNQKSHHNKTKSAWQQTRKLPNNQ